MPENSRELQECGCELEGDAEVFVFKQVGLVPPVLKKKKKSAFLRDDRFFCFLLQFGCQFALCYSDTVFAKHL